MREIPVADLTESEAVEELTRLADEIAAHDLASQGCRGSAIKAGASSSAKALARLPGSFWNGLALSCSSKGAIAALTSSRL